MKTTFLSISFKQMQTVILSIAIFISMTAFFACGGGRINDGDLTLTISLNKSEIAIGETVEVTVTFENHSGRTVSMWDWKWGRGWFPLPDEPLESIVQTTLVPKGTDINGASIFGLGMRLLPGIPRWNPNWTRIRLRSGAYSRTDTFTLDDSLWWWNHFELYGSDVEYLIVEAYVGFYAARGQNNDFITLQDSQKIALTM